MSHDIDTTDLLTNNFRALSARLGADPLQVQGAGGNTSIKNDDVMWIKASGTELRDALNKDIFVAVDRKQALEEAFERQGDGSCKSTVIDQSIKLRPSIETTFHAALNHKVVAHTHSVASLAHSISPEGRDILEKKLEGLPFIMVPYAKPGLPLTREILSRIKPHTKVIILQNHGLICCGQTTQEVSQLIEDVEKRLFLPHSVDDNRQASATPDDEFSWASESWMAFDERIAKLAISGSYYPDHVVFLGPALPTSDHIGKPPAILKLGEGVLVRACATSSQKAMLKCLSDVLKRVETSWTLEAIGENAERELLDWDAEKYRQALSEKS